jgi:curved DNA-binding protein CbpA
MANPDYYAILQVHPEADREVIGAAYRRLAAKYHPDVSALPDTAEKMKLLNEAYEVLSDPARRAAYDRSRGIRGTASGEGLRPVWSWRRFVVPIGLLVFILIAATRGIKLALMLLVLAAVIWVVVKLWK